VPIRFRCSHCDKLLAVGTRMAGSALRCPICNNPLTAPDPQKASAEPGANPITILPLGGDSEAAWWVDNPLLPSSTPPSEAVGVPADAPRGKPAGWWLSGEPPPPPPEPMLRKPEAAAPAQRAPSRSAVRSAPPSRPRSHPLLSWALGSRTRLAVVAAAAVGVVLAVGLVTGLLLKRRSDRPRPQRETAFQSTAPDPIGSKKPAQSTGSIPSDHPVTPPDLVRPRDERVKHPEQDPDSTPPAPPVREEPPLLPLPGAAMTPRPRPLVYKRRKKLTEDELRRQAEKAPEIGLSRAGDRTENRLMVQLAQIAQGEGRRVEIAPILMRQRVDLAGLPLRTGERFHADPAAAERLDAGSLALRAQLFEAAQAAAGPGRVPTGDTRPDPKTLHDAFSAAAEKEQARWLRPEAIPALLQLLMVENEAIRLLLVDQLAHIEGPRASVALAQRALFDTSADVRKEALEALSQRPVEEYLPALLEGFHYPWPAVADHAAEAIVSLQLCEAVPTLLRLLDQPDPQAPYLRPGKDGHFIREMVRVNHLHNCLMCHAPSFNAGDRLRGFIPPTDQPLPNPFSREAYQRRLPGQFVRADVTYLEQDFSVPLRVKNPGKWPDQQPYDFLVRERPALVADLDAHRPAKPPAPTEYQQAVLFALRELTGADPGLTSADWKRLFLGSVQVEALGKAVFAPGGVAIDASGRLLASTTQDRQLLRETGEGEFLPLKVSKAARALLATPWHGMTFDSKGRLCVCVPEAGRILQLDPGSREVRVLVESYQGKPLHGPVHLVVDGKGGLYFSDAAGTKEKGAVYHVSAQGTVTQLPLPLTRPRGLGLSPDGKILYVVSENSPDVMAYPLEGNGLASAGRVLCKLEGKKNTAKGAEGLAVDAQGNLYVANTALRAVQVFNPQGASLGLISLPEAPRYCAVVGSRLKTLYVSTQSELFRVRLDQGP
jgi:DNA-binding beta-propeller fold protein YncE